MGDFGSSLVRKGIEVEKEQAGLSLAEAAIRFLASLPMPDRQESGQEINRFVRWYGGERLIRELSGHEIASYCEGMAGSDPNMEKRLEPLRAFFAYAKKEGLTPSNLAVHLRVKKGSPKSASPARRGSRSVHYLTPQGHAKMKSRLEALKGERPRVADELRRAASDKDFRENAPLEAAREYQGQLEARIRELEATLKSSAILPDGQTDTAVVRIGNTIILRDLASGEELRYTLVSPSEVDATRGKISVASPVGRALLDRSKGEVVEVSVPAGKLRYRIEKVER